MGSSVNEYGELWISGLKDMTGETSKTEKQRKKDWGKKTEQIIQELGTPQKL